LNDIDNGRERATLRATLRRYASAERDHAWIGIADYEAGREYETPEWLAANRELAAAGDAVPWWLAGVAGAIRWGTRRRLGFYRRTEQW